MKFRFKCCRDQQLLCVPLSLEELVWFTNIWEKVLNNRPNEGFKSNLYFQSGESRAIQNCGKKTSVEQSMVSSSHKTSDHIFIKAYQNLREAVIMPFIMFIAAGIPHAP